MSAVTCDLGAIIPTFFDTTFDPHIAIITALDTFLDTNIGIPIIALPSRAGTAVPVPRGVGISTVNFLGLRVDDRPRPLGIPISIVVIVVTISLYDLTLDNCTRARLRIPVTVSVPLDHSFLLHICSLGPVIMTVEVVISVISVPFNNLTLYHSSAGPWGV
jgi:hypothetical protein